MHEYEFSGRNQIGEMVAGKRSAASETLLATQLVNEGITPINIELLKIKHQGQYQLRELLRRRPVRIEELRLFTRQMYTLTKAGVPIVDATARLAETTRNKSMRLALEKIMQTISAGQTFAAALQQHPKIFSPLFINVIKVGESTGNLEDAFQQMSYYLGMEEETLRRIKTALRYPSFVFVAIIAAMFVINYFVLPAFTQLFTNYHFQLPLATRVLITTSNIFVNHWGEIFFVIFLTLLLFRFYWQTPKGRYHMERRQLKMPIIGSILHRILLARFARTFAMLIRAGVTLTDGITLVADALGNSFLCEKIKSMKEHIARGEQLTQAASQTQIFSPLVIQMLAVGEETGNIDVMLIEVAEFYEREVDYELNRLGDAIEPIVLCALGMMVLILAVGVFLPMWDIVTVARFQGL